jgi:hypothetical protein
LEQQIIDERTIRAHQTPANGCAYKRFKPKAVPTKPGISTMTSKIINNVGEVTLDPIAPTIEFATQA